MLHKLSAVILMSAFATGICQAEIPVIKGEYWPDTEGKHINCHGGGIILGPDSTYYWYGEHRGFNAPQEGVACYTSKDLKTWQNRGIVMQVSDEPEAIVERGSTIERPKVIYNASTEKYVMWFHHELKGRGYSAARAAVAIADNPLGPFRPVRSARVNPGILPANIDGKYVPDAEDLKMEWWTPEWYKKIDGGMFVYRDLDGGQMSRDMTLFVDDDGTAYHIYSSEDNLTLQIAELDPTYTAHTGKYIRIFPGGHNEAPAIFKKDGRYWMITSGCTGWAPNAARLMWADSLMGEWHKMPNPCRGEGADITFGGQGTYILRVGDEITFMADIWNPKSLPDSRHLWLPVSFDPDGTPYISKENTAESRSLPMTARERIVQYEQWLDTDGNPINAHGGGILYHNGKYYWYGEYKKGKTVLPEWATWECYRTDVTGVSCYSSTDLVNWAFEGIVLPAEPDNQNSDLHPSKVIERPKVVYNSRTGKFVMWVHAESADYSKAAAGVAVSDSPTGPFTYIGSFRPNNAMSRDQTVFVDDDGKAYQFASSENNQTMYINELTDDYLRPTGKFTRNFIGEAREAPAVFKHNGKYYVLTSGCTGWDPNQASLAVADSIMGPWTTLGNPCTGKDADKTFYAQSTYVQPVTGKKNAYIAMFDRWNKTDLENSRYVWLPIEFDGERLTIPWLDNWNMDVFEK